MTSLILSKMVVTYMYMYAAARTTCWMSLGPAQICLQGTNAQCLWTWLDFHPFDTVIIICNYQNGVQKDVKCDYVHTMMCSQVIPRMLGVFVLSRCHQPVACACTLVKCCWCGIHSRSTNALHNCTPQLHCRLCWRHITTWAFSYSNV